MIVLRKSNGPQLEAHDNRISNKHSKLDEQGWSPDIVLIGSSTGGPTTLESIFLKLKRPISCPTIIVQHMPAGVTASFAERLTSISRVSVVEAKHNMALENGIVYIAPGNFHLRLKRRAGKVFAILDQEPELNWFRPAIDPLFSSAAEIFKDKCLAIVLTGMGSDGVIGCSRIKENNGSIIIQNEESCVVFGMPGAVKDAELYDKIASPDQICGLLNKI